jgi:hypothetical protein
MRLRGIWPGKDWLTDAFTNMSPPEAVRALVLGIAAQENALPVRYWGDKTPENVFELDLVARLWPDAYVLHVVRDPRSTVLSMHRAWGRSLIRGSVIWRDAQISACTFSAKAANRYRMLSFEALTANPGAEMDRVGSWLGLKFDHEILATVTSEERWGRASGATGVQQHKADWETALRPAQVRQIEEICFNEMATSGYSPAYATKAYSPSTVALKLAKAGDAFRVLRSYARERGWPAALSYKFRQWRNR